MIELTEAIELTEVSLRSHQSSVYMERERDNYNNLVSGMESMRNGQTLTPAENQAILDELGQIGSHSQLEEHDDEEFALERDMNWATGNFYHTLSELNSLLESLDLSSIEDADIPESFSIEVVSIIEAEPGVCVGERAVNTVLRLISDESRSLFE